MNADFRVDIDVFQQARRDPLQRIHRIILVGQQMPDRDVRQVLKPEEQPQVAVTALAPDPVGQIQQRPRLRLVFRSRGQRADDPAFLFELDRPGAPELAFGAFDLGPRLRDPSDPFVDEPLGINQRRGRLRLADSVQERFRAFPRDFRELCPSPGFVGIDRCSEPFRQVGVAGSPRRVCVFGGKNGKKSGGPAQHTAE